MHDRIATLYKDGQPFVSFVPREGWIATPGTIPWQLMRQIADSLGYEDRPLGWQWEHLTCVEPEPRVFVSSGPVDMVLGHRTAPFSLDFADADHVSFTYEVRSDYSA